jgi:hypothetical protein
MRVLITFEEDSSAEILDPTADSVWAIESASNREAARQRWSEDSYKGVEVTVFNPRPLTDLLPTVFEHHPDCDILEVRGAGQSGDVWRELARHDFVPLRQSPGVLRAGRRKGAV